MSVIVKPTEIDSVFEINSDTFVDNRGSFLNIFRENDKEFKNLWGGRLIRQINISTNKKVGTLRGMHLQRNPHAEAKIVRCLKGSIWDVAVDLRKDSKTFGKWHGVELNSENSKALFIPEGCAHGFQVLTKNSQIIYIHSKDWYPNSDIGVIWNDPDISINWPLPVNELSKKDQELPSLKEF